MRLQTVHPTAREDFCALVLTAPLMKADAIVVLCGEDAEERAAVAEGLMRQGAAEHVVLSGGLDGAGKKSARVIQGALMGRGVAPSRIILETQSTNTKEQAENVVAMAKERNWRQLLLVASPYHIVRATLTFIRSLNGQSESIRIVPVTANQTKWFEKPSGVAKNRLALLKSEFARIERYGDDVASYDEGIKYLQFWEGK